MKQRIISAVIAIIVVIPFIYFGGTIYAVGMAIVTMAGFIEMINLKKSHSDIPKIPVCIALTALIAFTFCRDVIYEFDYKQIIILLFGLLLPIIFYKNDKYKSSDALYLIGMILFLSMAFKSFIVVRDAGLPTFIYLVSIPVMTDTFAYFLGIKFGKHKMCPKISPKKSWEGCIAGLLGTILFFVGYSMVLDKVIHTDIELSDDSVFVSEDLSMKEEIAQKKLQESFYCNYLLIIPLGAIVSIISQIGDFAASGIKRYADIKDFSHLMPGHGGMLDRFDSVLFVAPVVYYTFFIIFHI